MDNKKSLISDKQGFIYWCFFGGITLFFCFYLYILEPHGDDIWTYFDRGITLFLDNYRNANIFGNRIRALAQVFDALKFMYLKWSGRIPGHALNFVGKLFPHMLRVIISAIIYAMIVLFAMRGVRGDIKRAIRAPLAIVMLFIVLFWDRQGIFQSYWWAIVTIYSLSNLLCVIYYNLTVVDEINGKIHNIWLIQLIGFFAGMCHEIISLCLIFMVIGTWFVRFLYREEEMKNLTRHVGLMVGYLVCVTAPGNFYRSQQSHDAIKTVWQERFATSLFRHKAILIGLPNCKMAQLVFYGVLPTAIICFLFFLCITKKTGLKRFFVENIGFIVSGVALIILYGAFSSYIPYYAMDFWIIMVYSVLFRAIYAFWDQVNENVPNKGIQWFFVVLICLSFVSRYGGEIDSYMKTSMKRRFLVQEGQKRNSKIVFIPKFSSKLPTTRYNLRYLNGQIYYNQPVYIEYYGAKLVVYGEND